MIGETDDKNAQTTIGQQVVDKLIERLRNGGWTLSEEDTIAIRTLFADDESPSAKDFQALVARIVVADDEDPQSVDS